MKVLFDYRMATWSGIGRYSQSLALALAQRDDVDLGLVVAQDDLEKNIVPEPLMQLPLFKASAHPLIAKGFREIRAVVREFNPDLVHCTHISTPNLKGVRTNAGKQVPVVTTLHDVTPLIVDGVMPSFAKRVIYSGLNQRALNWSDALITPSQHTVDDLRRFFPQFKTPISVIPLAADELKSIRPARPTSLKYLSPEFQQDFIFSFGNIKPHKDLPTLLAAFAEIADRCDTLSLLLVGKEPPNYLQQHLDARYHNRVRFTGPLSDEELVWLYLHAKAFAFPSLYEGFGLPPLEAMTFGCPTIVSDAASLPEVVGDGAVLVRSKDVQGFAEAIHRILTDENFTDDLEDRGMQRAKEFSWEKTADATVDVYRSVC